MTDELTMLDRSSVIVKIFLCGILTVTAFDSRAALAAEEPFVMSITADEPLYAQDGSGLFNLLVDEIFKRMNLEYQLLWLPAQRSLAFTNDGTVDGIVPRTRAVLKRYPNLVLVPGNVLDYEFMAFVKDSSIQVSGWDSLKPYTIGIMNGWKIVEQNVSEARAVVKANSREQLLRLLDKGRVDVAILDRVSGSWKLRQLGLDLQVVEPPIISRPNFIFLHKENLDLVPEIARIVQEMKDDGTFDAIYRKALDIEQ